MRFMRSSRLLISCLVGCLIVLLAATALAYHASASARALHPTITTNCPAPGTANAASMPSMTLGSHPTIVYIVNEGTAAQPTFGTLKRYDAVTGGKVEIVK